MEVDSFEKFRKQVKTARKGLYTQAEIAEKMGISQVAYSKLEKGEIKMSLDYALQLIEILNLENPFLPTQNSEQPLDMVIAQNRLLKEYFEMELRHTEDRVQFLKKVLGKETGEGS
jgi:transcriptional regulator with XRE-family HTH domain